MGAGEPDGGIMGIKGEHRGGVIGNRIDWLSVAIANMGGISRAAKVMAVSRQTIYDWLDDGIGTVQSSVVIKLARLSDVPLDFLAKRTGPWKD
jgi:hypothetical protein